jgi:hypothetical protein
MVDIVYILYFLGMCGCFFVLTMIRAGPSAFLSITVILTAAFLVCSSQWSPIDIHKVIACQSTQSSSP